MENLPPPPPTTTPPPPHPTPSSSPLPTVPPPPPIDPVRSVKNWREERGCCGGCGKKDCNCGGSKKRRTEFFQFNKWFIF